MGRPVEWRGTASRKKLIEFKILALNEKIFDHYEWDEVLQEEGCGGKVVVCKLKNRAPDDEKEYVMKMKSKAELQRISAENQFRRSHSRILNSPAHDGVLPIREILEDDSFYYVVMEKAQEGALLCSLLKEHADGDMPEKALKILMREVLAAVAHVHKQGMLHRDLKPDNFVVHVQEDPDSPTGKVRKVKLIDFDNADPEWGGPNSPLIEQAHFHGTLRFSAPEAFKGVYSQQSDLYSIGVILYLLVTGSLPYVDSVYEQKNLEGLFEIFDRMRRFRVNWEQEAWKRIPKCMDFCTQLLAFNLEDRPVSAEAAVSHSWFSSKCRRPRNETPSRNSTVETNEP
jgi:serine/threonine protein kinase